MFNNQQICIASDFAELKKIRDFIKSKAHDFDISTILTDNMVIAVDEACTNIIKHGFNENKKQELCINIEIDADNFIVNIYDNGKTFDPNKANSLNMKNYFKGFKKSGLGIYLIRALIDKIEYLPSNQKHDTNLLKLIIKIS